MSLKNDKRTIRRYLENLTKNNKIIYNKNEYCTDVIWDVKNIIENALSSEYFKKVDKWDLPEMYELLQNLISDKEELKDVSSSDMMMQMEYWINEHVKIYLSSNSKYLDDDSFNRGIMQDILSLINLISMKANFINLFLSDKPFTIIINVKPTPIKLVDMRAQ